MNSLRFFYLPQIVSPSGIEDDCFIQSIDADTFSVRFMPRENGIHNIHIKFNGVHIPGSPFRIRVGKEDADPAAVHAHGSGLGEVKTGSIRDIKNIRLLIICKKIQIHFFWL